MIKSQKHSHLSNGLQLTSQTVHFFVSWKKNFRKTFSLKIVLFLFFLFEFNVFNKKIPETKYSHLSNGSPLISQNVHFHSVLFFFFFFVLKIIFLCQNSSKIVFVQLISNENDLFFNCAKVPTQMK